MKKIVFGTTNKRKVEDLQNVINKMNLEYEVLSMDDIGWDRGEIVEDGNSIQQNSLIKAKAILSFCHDHNICYPIITDDSGLFVDALDGDPGIYTARYADDEIALNPELPKYQCVLKLLRELNGNENRSASLRCCVTTMFTSGIYYQEFGKSDGTISNEVIGELKKPYFYSVFILNNTNVPFSQLSDEEWENTYRSDAFRRSLKRL